MFIVVTKGSPNYAHCMGTKAYCLRYIMEHGLRTTAWLETF